MDNLQSRGVQRLPCDQDWESKRAVIETLYTSRHLKDVMTTMAAEHGFKATENQYKKQLNKWKVDPKRLKGAECKAIIRIKRERDREDPPKGTAFRLRGEKVDESKIIRFQKRHKIDAKDDLSDITIPPDLSWSTPSPTLCRVEIPSPTRHSPRLSPFEWFHAFGEFIHESAVGSPVLESDNILGLLRTFVGFVPTYALQREYSNHVRSLQVTQHCPNCWISCAMDEIKELFIREQDPNKAQALLGAAIDDYLSTIDHKGSSLLTPCEDLQNCSLWIAKIFPVVHTVVQACFLYAITGKDEEAAVLLARLVSNVRREIPELYKPQDVYSYVLWPWHFAVLRNKRSEEQIF